MCQYIYLRTVYYSNALTSLNPSADCCLQCDNNWMCSSEKQKREAVLLGQSNFEIVSVIRKKK